MIKHAGNTNYIKAMEILGSGACGWKNRTPWNALRALRPIALKNNENKKRNSVDTQQFVLFFIYKLLVVTYLDSWYIKNLSIFRTQDIQGTVNF